MAEHIFNGKWICADMTLEDRFAPVFKRNFSIKTDIKSARVYLCGLGLFELRVNSVTADDTLLNPAHTQYSSTVLYRAFDVTSLLNTGENEITVALGHGFFNETVDVWKWQNASWRGIPRLLCDIEIECADGTVQQIVTDEDWVVSCDGVVTSNSIYYGEIHDYRNKCANWQRVMYADAPRGNLKLQNMPPMRRVAELAPQSITHLGGNSYVITTPEMVTGWAKIKMPLNEGQVMTVTYGEKLLPDGRVVHIGKGEGRDGKWFPAGYIQQDAFIGDGEACEFEPRFSYKGFHYLQIDNCPVEPDAESIVIYRVANDVENVARFSCSNALINDLHSLMRRTIINNLQGKPTDTPVWEKNGWLGDLSCGLWSMMFNFDMNTFLQSFENTMADCFKEYGMVPVMVPAADWGIDNNPVWNTVFVFVAQALLDYYGETDYVKDIYPTLKAYALEQIKAIESRGWVWDCHTLADWLAPVGGSAFEESQPNSSEGAEICASAFIYKMLTVMADIALQLGEQDGSVYTEASEKILDAFNKKFYDSQRGYYQSTFWKPYGCRTRYRQTSNLLPLAFGMVEESERTKVVKNLADDIISKEYHLDTGCTGTRFVLPVLFDNGYGDIAYNVLTQTTYPSWGYWLTQGSDSAWESWENTTRSMNHYFLGSFDEALFTHLAGIRNIKKGFTEFTFDPQFNCGLENLNLELKTPGGNIVCSWTVKDNACKINLTVPDSICVHSKIPLKKVNALTGAGEFTAEIRI